MLDEIIFNLIKNRKKYLGCILGFIIALLIINYGIWKSLFVIVASTIGYLSGIPNIVDKIKNLFEKE